MPTRFILFTMFQLFWILFAKFGMDWEEWFHTVSYWMHLGERKQSLSACTWHINGHVKASGMNISLPLLGFCWLLMNRWISRPIWCAWFNAASSFFTVSQNDYRNLQQKEIEQHQFFEESIQSIACWVSAQSLFVRMAWFEQLGVVLLTENN